MVWLTNNNGMTSNTSKARIFKKAQKTEGLQEYISFQRSTFMRMIYD